MHIEELYREIMSGRTLFEDERIVGRCLDSSIEAAFRNYMESMYGDNVPLKEPLVFRKCSFFVHEINGLYLPHSYMDGVLITYSIIPHSNFAYSRWQDCEIEHSDISYSSYEGATFSNVIFNNTIDVDLEMHTLPVNSKKIFLENELVERWDTKYPPRKIRSKEKAEEIKKCLELQAEYIYNEFL